MNERRGVREEELEYHVRRGGREQVLEWKMMREQRRGRGEGGKKAKTMRVRI